MRVTKSLQQSLLFTPFTVEQQHRLGIATLLAFTLGEKGPLLTEQQMWQPFTEGEEELLLDRGVPKQQGEWLLKGSAYSLQPHPCIRVAAAVAGIEKQLDVYGPRSWLQDGRASAPLPFTQHPLQWETADASTTEKVDLQGNSQQQPARIFYPQQVQLEQGQRVKPAGFLPLACNHPERTPYQGSYDAEWQQLHWPGFPCDLNWRYFNIAPLDQQLQGFFQGGETYFLVNLHPSRPKINGYLPHDHPRAFIYYHDGSFHELKLQCDTVWLFPDHLLGIMVYHGVAAIQDDEAEDVAQLILGVEPPHATPLPVDHYHMQTQRTVVAPIDLQHAADQTQTALTNAKKMLDDIPQLLHFKLAQIAGKAPFPQANLLEQQALCIPQLATHLHPLKTTYSWLQAHPVSQETLNRLQQAQQQLITAQQHLQQLPAQLNALQQQLHVHKEKWQQNCPATMPHLACDSDQPLFDIQSLTTVPLCWSAQAGRLVALAQPALQLPEQQQQLQSVALRPFTQQRYLLGYLTQPLPFIASEWQVASTSTHCQTIGPGWLLPEFQGNQLTALTVRPGYISEATRDYRIPGSLPGSWYSGLDPMRIKVLVTELLLGLRLAQEIDDIIDVIVMPSPESPLAPHVWQALQQSHMLFLPLADPSAICPWRIRLPHIQPLSLGRYDHLAARLEEQTDHRRWLCEQLQITPLPQQEPTAHQFLTIASQHKLQQLANDTGYANPLAVEAHFNQHLAQMKAQLLELPLPTQLRQQLLSKLTAVNVPPQQEFGAQMKTAQTYLQRVLHDLHQLLARYPRRTAEQAAAMTTFQQQLQVLIQTAIDCAPQAVARCAESTAETARHYRRLTRTQLVAAYQSGEALVQVDLTGVDLSHLDLAHIDLSGAILHQANFAYSNLRHSRLVDVIATRACFSQTDLTAADLTRALLSQADLTGVRGVGCQLREALLHEAQCNDAQFDHASWIDASAERAHFQRASFVEADLTQALFSGADFTAAQLTKACLDGTLLHAANLSQSCLQEAYGKQTHFWAINGAHANLRCARFPNARFGPAHLLAADLQEAILPQMNLVGAQAQEANFTAADLSSAYISSCVLIQALFIKANLQQAQLVRCNLEQAILRGANFMWANVMKNRLVGADCRQCNFFNSDLRQLVVGETQWQGASFCRTLLHHQQQLLETC